MSAPFCPTKTVPTTQNSCLTQTAHPCVPKCLTSFPHPFETTSALVHKCRGFLPISSFGPKQPANLHRNHPPPLPHPLSIPPGPPPAKFFRLRFPHRSLIFPIHRTCQLIHITAAIACHEAMLLLRTAERPGTADHPRHRRRHPLPMNPTTPHPYRHWSVYLGLFLSAICLFITLRIEWYNAQPGITKLPRPADSGKWRYVTSPPSAGNTLSFPFELRSWGFF